MITFGLVISITVVATISSADFDRPGTTLWEDGGAVLRLEIPYALFALALWLAHETPMFPWVRTRARVAIAFGVAVIIAAIGILIEVPKIGFSRSLCMAFIAEWMLMIVGLLSLVSVVYTLRWRWWNLG